MKRILLIAGALIAPVASIASTEAINLSWNDCGFDGQMNASFACNSTIGSPFTMVGSFYAPTGGLPEYQGMAAVIDIWTAEAALPDWWRHGSTECRGTTGLSTSFDFTAGPFTCFDFFAGQATGGFAYQIGVPAPNRARLLLQGQVPSEARGPIDDVTEYYAFKVTLTRSKTTGVASCAGCAVPACIVLDQIQLFQPAGPNPVITSPFYRNYVTWQNDPGAVFRDADGDGYGTLSSSSPGCPHPPPPGYVSNASDCDDTRASVHPGAPESGCDGLDNDCNGLMDDVPSGILGLWKAEGNANDSVGTNHGTLRNGATFAGGEVGQAFSMDGIDDYVGNVGTAATFSFIQNTGIFTIEAWIKLNDPNALGEQAITANTATTVEKGHYLIWDNSAGARRLTLLLMKGEVGNPVISSSSPNQVITDSNWHHVAAVGNGAGITFYVDGVAFAGSGAMGSKPTGSATRALDIGRCGNAQCQFGGQLDELALHNRALSASEIQSIFNAGSGGRCAGVASVSESQAAVPTLRLGAPWPNPVSRSVDLDFQLPGSASVGARVVDITGRQVASLMENRRMPAGAHRLRWDCHDASGQRVAPGVYLVRISTGAAVAFQRIVVLQ